MTCSGETDIWASIRADIVDGIIVGLPPCTNHVAHTDSSTNEFAAWERVLTRFPLLAMEFIPGDLYDLWWIVAHRLPVGAQQGLVGEIDGAIPLPYNRGLAHPGG